MSREAVETLAKDGFTAEILHDEDPMSPKEWDQLGTLVTWHRSYCFDQDGRKVFGSPAEFLGAAKEGGWIFLPVAMIDHSGISLYEGTRAHICDPGGWDSGQVGFIYTTPERMKVIGTPTSEVENVLRGELEQWDQYVTGDVYGVVVSGPDSGVRESCWGFYGLEYAKQEAQEMLDAEIEHEKREKAKIDRMMAL